VRAASLFRGFFVQAAEGIPIDQILEERGAVLDLADRTLDLWSSHLGLEVNSLLDVQEEVGPREPTAINPLAKPVIVPLADYRAKKAGTSQPPVPAQSRKQKRGPFRGDL
jgi:hypothetical protein